MEILFRSVCRRLFELCDDSDRSKAKGNECDHNESNIDIQQQTKELLNCLRLLTRILPFLFEKQRSSSTFRAWMDNLLWAENDTSNKCLAKKLIDTATSLLFRPGFTITEATNNVIWETGVGCTIPMAVTHDIIQHRVEVLRFLLALSSDCLYTTATNLATQGSPFVGYMVTRSTEDKHQIMAVLCALLNTCLKYSPGWKVPYEHVLIFDRSKQLVAYSLQYLLVLLVYPSPQPGTDRNWYRSYMSKIYRPNDLQFMADSLARLLSQPISALSSYLPGSQKQIQWVTELCMMFWEVVQCNKKLKNYLLKSGHIHDFVVLFLFYVNEQPSVIITSSTTRLCGYILVYLTSEPEIAKSLSLHRFEGQGFLPNGIKLSPFNGSYMDYLIIQQGRTIIDLLTGASGSLTESVTSEPFHLASNLLNCIYNISPYITGISYPSASSLVTLFLTLSSSQNMSIEAIKTRYLSTVLNSIKNMLDYHFRANKKLAFVIWKNEKAFRSMHSQAVKGKQRGESSDQASALAELLPLLDWFHKLLDQLEQKLPYAEYFTTDYSVNGSGPELQPHMVIESIGSLGELAGFNLTARDPSSSEFTPCKFSWTTDSLGWYESILWGSIYQSESQVGYNSGSIGEVAVGMYSPVVGVWNGTSIKLFRLREIVPQGPSILRPKGAVDAVADSMIQSFSKLATRPSGEGSHT